MTKSPAGPKELFHIGTVLSVLRDNPEFSGKGLLGQARLLNFLCGLKPEVNSVMLMDPAGFPATAPDALVISKDEYQTLLAECRAELLHQFPRLKDHENLTLEVFRKDPYAAVATYGLRLHVEGKAPRPA